MNRLLECFVVCAEELNFSHAAKKLHISQQALSSSIQKLEKEYQVQLFERKPRVKLTEAGEQLLIRARYILSAEEELRTTLSGLSDSAVGSITIGSSVLRARMFMPSLWPSYHSQYPKVHISLKTSNSSLMTDELLDGDIDLYIGQCYQTLPAFNVQLLAEEPSFFIASLELLKQHISKETILDLQLRTAEGIFLEDLFRLADFALETLDQYTGFMSDVNGAYKYAQLCSFYALISDRYMHYVTAIRNGDVSEETLNNFRITFEMTRSYSMKCINTLFDLDNELASNKDLGTKLIKIKRLSLPVT